MKIKTLSKLNYYLTPSAIFFLSIMIALGIYVSVGHFKLSSNPGCSLQSLDQGGLMLELDCSANLPPKPPPPVNLTVADYSTENETLRLQFTKTEFNTSEEARLELRNNTGGKTVLSHRDQRKTNSTIASTNGTGVLDWPVERGDTFTIEKDGSDLDNDGIYGVDYPPRNQDLIGYRLYKVNQTHDKRIARIKFIEGIWLKVSR